MRIHILGGGPAGLYLGILMKQQDPSHEIIIKERNRLGDTFGFGVVFSDQTLGNLEEADPVSFKEIQKNFAYWQDIETWYGGQMVRSTGHGFCGMARVRLLEILSHRAQELGCQLQTETDVADIQDWMEADVVVAADGVNSRVRQRFAEQFRPTVEMRACRFLWLGAKLRLPAFTFIFRQTEHGLFRVHAYPYDTQTSTFIIECREETWRASGLNKMSEAQTLQYFEGLFGDHLHGQPLIINNSGGWRQFPNIRCQSWHYKNLVILGDAAHTAHFSIGSGTKLAMEDAISLAAALKAHPHVPDALQAYEATRRPEVDRIQHAARTSLEWFEQTERYMHQDPIQFNFNLMTRSKRITYDALQQRDPALVEQVRAQFAQGIPGNPPPAFTPYTIRDVTLLNRIVVSPMCQYSATDGMPADWHLVHLGSRAVGGAGLLITEATAISPDGRITPGCTGIWNDEQAQAWKRIVDFVHANSQTKIALQIGHAGRKAACHVPWEGGHPLPPEQAWPLQAPSALAWDADSQTPQEMTLADIDQSIQNFVAAAQRAKTAGFDWLELHFAHGYLISTFLSPLTNQRQDAYGGSLENRLRLPCAIVKAVRAVWTGPISVRISAIEWAEGGTTDAERCHIAQALQAAGADILDISAGGVVAQQKPVYGRMFQVPFSDLIRNEAKVPTMTVGAIEDVDQVNTILAAGRADLCLLARAHLANPYLSLHAASRYGVDVAWPHQYLAAKPTRKKG